MNGKKIYMMAICGMGMGSLAGYLKESGAEVTGSDTNIYPPMSDFLSSLKIPVKKGYDGKNLDDNYDAVIVGNAITKNNPEAEKLVNSELEYFSMPGFMEKYLLQNKRSLVVAGTHGKTTTASLLGWVLTSAGLNPSVFIGGIVKEWGKSYRRGESEYFVLEGDEYDSSFFDKVPKFLHYRTHDLILTGVEFDHADIYGSLDEIKNEFKKLVKSIPEDGNIIAYGDDKNVREIITCAKCNVITYGLNDNNMFTFKMAEFEGGITVFDVMKGREKVLRIESPLLGKHNVQNTMAVSVLLKTLNVAEKEIIRGIKSFPGVKRRQEIIAKISGITVIDDFAHHPTAVRLTLEGFRMAFPDSRIWAVFEPRTNTARRNYFQNELASSFKNADRVIISDVFKKDSLKADEILNVKELVKVIKKDSIDARLIENVEKIVDTLTKESKAGDIIVLMSNGGFGGIYSKLISSLKKIS